TACSPAFGWKHLQPSLMPTLLLVPLPFLLWAAVRLGVGGTSLALLAFAGSILASALAGRGPLALSSPIENVHALTVHLITIPIPLLLLAALVEDQAQAENFLRQSKQRLLTLQREEHQRIAEELHDSTVQHLTAMGIYLTDLRATADGNTAQTID